ACRCPAGRGRSIRRSPCRATTYAYRTSFGLKPESDPFPLPFPFPGPLGDFFLFAGAPCAEPEDGVGGCAAESDGCDGAPASASAGSSIRTVDGALATTTR